MTVSIANLTATWIDTGNAYSAIAMNVAAPFGANVGSRVLNLSVASNTLTGSIYSVDANGISHSYTFTVSTLPWANAAGRGARSFVIDCSNAVTIDANGNYWSNFGNTVIGGG